MKRSRKIAIAVASALVVALVAGGAALASGHLHEGFMKRRMTRHIDAALDAVAATPSQRDAVHAARDHVFATFAESHHAEQADLQAALSLWEADHVDTTQLASIRARHQAAAQKSGDAVVQALSDAHDTLTADQRQKLAQYLRAHQPMASGKAVDGAKPFMHHMLTERVDDMLDQIHATADQRTKVGVAVERAFSALSANVGGHAAHLDEAIAVFTADKLDPTKLQALQAERQAAMQKTGDAVIEALTEVHDTLTASQRKQVADLIRSHHHAGGHGG